MMDLLSILKVAIPIAGSILLDENISPIKQENPYRPIIKDAIDTTVKVLDSSSIDTKPIKCNQSQSIEKTPFEIAKCKKYKYMF